MTQRDMVLAAIRHEEGPVPFSASIELLGNLSALKNDPIFRRMPKTFMQAGRVITHGLRIGSDIENVVLDGYGAQYRIDHRPIHMIKPALQTPSLEGFKWPPSMMFCIGGEELELERKRMAYCSQTQFTYASIDAGFCETPWALRGFQQWHEDLILEPEFVNEVLDRIERSMEVFVAYTCVKLSSVDAIMFSDDWGDQRGVTIGADRWRELVKPRWARIYDLVHKHGKYVISHCCGSVREIMDDIVEIGLDVLESCQPEAAGMNPYELKRGWGDKLAFWGCLGTQGLLPFGTPEAIKTEVRKIFKEMGKGGGFIFSPAKPIQPGTPVENVRALVDVLCELSAGYPQVVHR